MSKKVRGREVVRTEPGGRDTWLTSSITLTLLFGVIGIAIWSVLERLICLQS